MINTKFKTRWNLSYTTKTSRSNPYPTRLKTKSVKPYGWIVLDQIRTIDKSHIIKKIGQLTSDEISACKCILEELLVW